MKALRLISFIFLCTCFTANAQVYQVTLLVNGSVTDTITGLPVPYHQVTMTVLPDSIYTFAPVIDSALTDASGYFFISLTSPWVPGTALPFEVSTLDCQGLQFTQYNSFTGSVASFYAPFSICTDSIPPSLCDNYIQLTWTQQLNASFHGGMVNPQTASYYWEFGDGTTGFGPDVTHTFPAQGSYTIQLSSFTADSCNDISHFFLYLGDSIPPNCSNSIGYSTQPGSLLVSFQGYSSSFTASTFSWIFGDSTSGVNNSSVLQNPYHQYSFPGLYSVSLTTTDATGCTYQSILPVHVSADSIIIVDTLGISGSIFAADSIPLPYGQVTLFKSDSTGSFYMDQETWFINYVYFFNYLSPGNYLILATPYQGTVWFTQYLPTYYGDAIFWEDATLITLGYPQNPYYIHYVAFDSIGGGVGGINGQILQGGGKSNTVANQEVVLVDLLDNPVKYTYTDSYGNFSFPSLPLGSYIVHPNITGIIAYPVSVTLDPQNTQATVNMTINGNTITGIIDRPSSPIIGSVYPNPASAELRITVKKGHEGMVKVEILDASGRLVISQASDTYAQDDLIRINIESLSAGMYILRVRDQEGNTSGHKFMKD
jgi:PKD repeat protein